MSVKFRCKHRGLCTQVGHGSWSFVHSWTEPDGTRRQVRKSGFATQSEAAAALSDAQSALADHAGFEGWKSRDYYVHASALLALDRASLDLPVGTKSVYVFLAGAYLKIGVTGDLAKREGELRGVRHRSNRPLEADVVNGRMLGSIPGDHETERLLQHFARNFWVQGEWFVAHPGLIAELARITTRMEIAA